MFQKVKLQTANFFCFVKWIPDLIVLKSTWGLVEAGKLPWSTSLHVLCNWCELGCFGRDLLQRNTFITTIQSLLTIHIGTLFKSSYHYWKKPELAARLIQLPVENFNVIVIIQHFRNITRWKVVNAKQNLGGSPPLYIQIGHLSITQYISSCWLTIAHWDEYKSFCFVVWAKLHLLGILIDFGRLAI